MVVQALGIATILYGTVLLGGSAEADWVVSGAQTRCDANTGQFRIVPFDRTDEGVSAVEPGFTVAPDGWSQIECMIGDRRLITAIEVIPPQPTGCLGIGAVEIRSLSLDGSELHGPSISFGGGCSTRPFDPREDAIVEIRIEDHQTTVLLVICSAPYNPFTRTQGTMTCESKSIVPKPVQPQ
jgi:hypothetical protein